MITMQYRFVLPADYDMGIIRQRIEEKGHLLDNFPGLVFKAYLFADTRRPDNPAPLNLYAPLYLWDNTDGMKRFLCCQGFEALQRAYGRPEVMSWIPLEQRISPALRQARFASRELIPIAPFTSLSELEAQEKAHVAAALKNENTLASVSAIDPANWTLARFSLLAEPVERPSKAGQETYQVGYVAGPENLATS